VKKLMLSVMAVITFGLLLSSCAGAGRTGIPVYTDPADNISVRSGDEFVIALAYDPDAGYLWYEEYDNTKLQLLESTCAFCRVGQEEFTGRQGYVSTVPNLPPAAQYSRFKALSPGETMVTMAYKDSSTAEAVEEKIFTVTIE
jgi:predicted secreted protein